MKSKGLGTGLGAIFGDAANETASSDFEYIQIQRIEPRIDQPRSVFEQDKIDDLAESIREHGILSPLTVRRLDNGYYQIIAGERRWRAARDAGLAEVPVRIVEADDKKALELALVENLQREDLSPIEEAKGYKALIEDFAMTQEQVAHSVSKSRPAVANALRLLSLPDDIVKMVTSGEISAGSARALLALDSSEKMLETAYYAVSNALSVREVETLVKKTNGVKPAKKRTAAPDIEVDYIKEAQIILSSAMGRRVIIKQGKDKGKIEIEYYGQQDFDDLFDTLQSTGLALGDTPPMEE